MADFNPLTSLPDPKDFMGQNMGGTFMLPGFFQANQQRQEAAAPFIEMARQAEQEKIAQAQKLNPLILAEKAGLNEKTGLENARYRQLTPFAVREADLKNAGMETGNAIKGIELASKARDFGELPFKELESKIAHIYGGLQDLPMTQRAEAYRKSIDELHNTITDPALAERFRKEYGGDLQRSYLKGQMAHSQGFHTPAYAQALAVAKEHSKSAERVANIHAGSAKTVAEIHERAQKAVQQMTLDNPKNAAVMVAKARAWLASPPADATPEQKAQMEGIVSGDDDLKAEKLYRDYLGSLAGINDGAKNNLKPFSYFREVIKQGYKAPSTPRAGPTNEAARDLNVGAGLVTDSKGQRWKYKGTGDPNKQENYEKVN